MNDPAKTKSETEETAKNETTEAETAVPEGEVTDQDLRRVAGGVSAQRYSIITLS